ncbi:MAG: YHS domain-containing protein [Betaproteobacteria bacterium]|nr:YHS domain-containing protein [Betaproteobacteria bacterium]
MDPATLKSLGTILLWGVLFFVLMRFGCGAHIMGGHGHHGGQGGGDDAGGTVKDPVCGMDVEPGKAAAASVYRGRTHYFCSTSCRDKFEKDPAKFAAGTEAQATHGGHHHG